MRSLDPRWCAPAQRSRGVRSVTPCATTTPRLAEWLGSNAMARSAPCGANGGFGGWALRELACRIAWSCFWKAVCTVLFAVLLSNGWATSFLPRRSMGCGSEQRPEALPYSGWPVGGISTRLLSASGDQVHNSRFLALLRSIAVRPRPGRQTDRSVDGCFCWVMSGYFALQAGRGPSPGEILCEGLSTGSPRVRRPQHPCPWQLEHPLPSSMP